MITDDLETNGEQVIYNAKGDFVSGGGSGIVERVSPHHVTKSPWPGRDEAQNRRDIEIEAAVYSILGRHQRFIKFFGHNSVDGSITLAYMANGTVRDFVQRYNDKISTVQRVRWALQAAEGLHILHSAKILHCDFSPRNLLLDANLTLKVADFGGCSVDGSWSSAGGSVRFYLPRPSKTPPTAQSDIFALGSTIYEIMTGRIPYNEVSSAQVKHLYRLSQFPDLHGVYLGDVIRDCWLLRFKSTEEVYNTLLSTDMARITQP